MLAIIRMAVAETSLFFSFSNASSKQKMSKQSLAILNKKSKHFFANDFYQQLHRKEHPKCHHWKQYIYLDKQPHK